MGRRLPTKGSTVIQVVPPIIICYVIYGSRFFWGMNLLIESLTERSRSRMRRTIVGEREASPEARRYVVARADEVPEGGRLIVEVAGREIGIFNIDGEFFALRNRCPHLGAPLCTGDVLGLVHSSGPGDVRFDDSKKLLTCPWHGWEFDIKTGQSYFNPRLRARRYDVEARPVEATGEGVQNAMPGRVPGPYEAEVVPVSREDDYIVITVSQRSNSAPTDAAV